MAVPSVLTVAPVRGRVRRERPAVRLTRRGRAAVLVLLLALAAVLAAFAAPASRAADPSGAAETAVVQPGDTLWSIAERRRPGRDPFGTIDAIRHLNGLTDYTVHPGQRLRLPPPR
jgi:Tfp pilus assembly protein FimV